MNGYSSPWTSVRDDHLRRLFGEGLSFSWIATHLGVSRNAAIGRAHRLGMKRGGPSAPGIASGRPRSEQLRAPTPKPRTGPGSKAVSAAAKSLGRSAPPPPREPMPAPASTDRATVDLLGLRTGMCRFPVGEPKHPDFGFCGAQADGEGPYCATHARLCFIGIPAKGPKSGAELARSLRRFCG